MNDIFKALVEIARPPIMCCGIRAAVLDPYGDRWSPDLCPDCRDNRAERAYERSMEDGEAFRGGEAAAYNAEQLDKIRRELK